MTTLVDTKTCPELRQLFGAYLNADFARHYGSVAEALAAYRRETGATHRSGARAELDRLVAAPGAIRTLACDFAGLGCEVALATPSDAWNLAATIRRILD